MRFSFRIILTFILFPIFTFGQGLVIHSGATFVNKDKLVIKNDLKNDGTFFDNSGTVYLSGTTQDLSGTSTTPFNNLTITPSSTTTLSSSGFSLKKVLVCNGTLNTGGNFTLLSTASNTSLIDGTGSGDVLGYLTMQRYLTSGFGYKYFSSPFQAATVSEFSDNMDLGAAFASFYKYDENVITSGWVNYTNPIGLLDPLHGYAVNFGGVSAPSTADVSGVVNNGTLSIVLSNNNKPFTKGFNLIGNPYPSPIDWDASSGWTKTNIDDALYYFDAGITNQYTGTYSTYIGGVSSDGIANNIIPSMQGVFVHVSDGTYPVVATLGCNNNVRVNNLTPTFHKKIQKQLMPLMRLTAMYRTDATLSDYMVIYFDSSASMGFENERDAYKLINTDENVPNIYSISTESAHLSISAIPYPVDSITKIPLGLKTLKKGWVSIKLQDIDYIPTELHVYLYDIIGGYQDIEKDREYHVYLDSGMYENRFSIVFSKKDLRYQPSSEALFYTYSSGSKLFVYLNLSAGEQAELTVNNAIGQKVIERTVTDNGYHEYDLNVGRGVYIVNLRSKRNVYSKKVYIST